MSLPILLDYIVLMQKHVYQVNPSASDRFQISHGQSLAEDKSDAMEEIWLCDGVCDLPVKPNLYRSISEEKRRINSRAARRILDRVVWQ